MTAAAKSSLVGDRDRAIDALATSPAGRKALLDHAAQTLKDRAALVAERAQLDEIAERELPSLRAEVNAAYAEYADARGSFQRGYFNAAVRAPAAAAGILAQAKFSDAQQKSAVASLAYSARRDKIDHELRRTASRAIRLFITEMFDTLAATKRTTIETQSLRQKNPITGRTTDIVASNAASIAARMVAIRAAMAAAEDMALEADQADVELRLEKLRQALPALGRPELRK